jgi:hypothetical protein
MGVENNTEVDQRKDNKVRGHEMTSKAVITDKQSAKLVNPGKSAFGAEAELVNSRVKKASRAGFWPRAISRVVSNIGDEAIVEANFASGASVKGGIGIEERMGNRDAQTLEKFANGFEVISQLPGIIVIARNNVGASNNEAITVGNWQDIGCFGAFASLVGNGITALFGNGMTAVKIQVCSV